MQVRRKLIMNNIYLMQDNKSKSQEFTFHNRISNDHIRVEFNFKPQLYHKHFHSDISDLAKITPEKTKREQLPFSYRPNSFFSTVNKPRFSQYLRPLQTQQNSPLKKSFYRTSVERPLNVGRPALSLNYRATFLNKNLVRHKQTKILEPTASLTRKIQSNKKAAKQSDQTAVYAQKNLIVNLMLNSINSLQKNAIQLLQSAEGLILQQLNYMKKTYDSPTSDEAQENRAIRGVIRNLIQKGVSGTQKQDQLKQMLRILQQALILKKTFKVSERYTAQAMRKLGISAKDLRLIDYQTYKRHNLSKILTTVSDQQKVDLSVLEQKQYMVNIQMAALSSYNQYISGFYHKLTSLYQERGQLIKTRNSQKQVKKQPVKVPFINSTMPWHTSIQQVMYKLKQQQQLEVKLINKVPQQIQKQVILLVGTPKTNKKDKKTVSKQKIDQRLAIQSKIKQKNLQLTKAQQQHSHNLRKQINQKEQLAQCLRLSKLNNIKSDIKIRHESSFKKVLKNREAIQLHQENYRNMLQDRINIRKYQGSIQKSVSSWRGNLTLDRNRIQQQRSIKLIQRLTQKQMIKQSSLHRNRSSQRKKQPKAKKKQKKAIHRKTDDQDSSLQKNNQQTSFNKLMQVQPRVPVQDLDKLNDTLRRLKYTDKKYQQHRRLKGLIEQLRQVRLHNRVLKQI